MKILRKERCLLSWTSHCISHKYPLFAQQYNVTQMKLKDLSNLSSNEFSSLFFFTGVINKCQ